MPSKIEQVLMERGPCLSSALAAELSSRFQLSEAAARKQISRAKHPVQHLDLAFQYRATFVYLSSQYQTERFFRALTDALEANNGAYSRALSAIGACGGILPLSHLAAAAGLSDTDGQLGVEEVVSRLVHENLLTRIEVPGQGECVAYAASVEQEEAVPRMKARLVAEGVLLEAFKQWARNLALGSYDSFSLRGEAQAPKVGRFEWCSTAPSYLSGLSSWDEKGNKLKPGFLVADVLLNREVDEGALQPFLYKCATLRRVTPGRCMQFFLADRFTHDALMQLRKYGVVPGRVDELFGREVAEALKVLIATLTQTAAAAVEPAKFDKLFSGLGRFGAAAGTLRGALFEFFAAALLREDGWHDVVLNKVYREAGKNLAEVDVRARKGDEVLFVECKGIAPGTVLSDSEVQKWLETRVPAVASRARQTDDYDNCHLKFELWITGELSEVAKEMIATRQRTVRHTKYTVEVRQGPDMKLLAQRHKRRQPALLAVLEQHFLASPLSEARELELKAAKFRADTVVWHDLKA